MDLHGQQPIAGLHLYRCKFLLGGGTFFLIFQINSLMVRNSDKLEKNTDEKRGKDYIQILY